ncbi:MAG: sensor histidine kinase [Spirochaetales bacterium]|nr:sensor histidine kinase [Spirochaetales bacterium]
MPPQRLIVTELVSNALKHAFLDGRQGKITVVLSVRRGETIVLKVSDTGIGFPHEYDFKNADTLGLTLVNSLVSQLRGTLEVRDDGGTVIIIEFSQPAGSV